MSWCAGRPTGSFCENDRTKLAGVDMSKNGGATPGHWQTSMSLCLGTSYYALVPRASGTGYSLSIAYVLGGKRRRQMPMLQVKVRCARQGNVELNGPGAEAHGTSFAHSSLYSSTCILVVTPREYHLLHLLPCYTISLSTCITCTMNCMTCTTSCMTRTMNT